METVYLEGRGEGRKLLRIPRNGFHGVVLDASSSIELLRNGRRSVQARYTVEDGG